MPKTPRLTARDAEKLLMDSGFVLARTKGSHRIYTKNKEFITIPFHPGKILHPKIAAQIMALTSR